LEFVSEEGVEGEWKKGTFPCVWEMKGFKHSLHIYPETRKWRKQFMSKICVCMYELGMGI
jgi:hypothetical protein